MSIIKYTHTCIISDGAMAGSTYMVDVDYYDIKYKSECPECGELLATPEQIIAHIYEELTN